MKLRFPNRPKYGTESVCPSLARHQVVVIVPESPRWQLFMGMKEEATATLAFIAEYNRTTMPEVSLSCASRGLFASFLPLVCPSASSSIKPFRCQETPSALSCLRPSKGKGRMSAEDPLSWMLVGVDRLMHLLLLKSRTRRHFSTQQTAPLRLETAWVTYGSIK